MIPWRRAASLSRPWTSSWESPAISLWNSRTAAISSGLSEIPSAARVPSRSFCARVTKAGSVIPRWTSQGKLIGRHGVPP